MIKTGALPPIFTINSLYFKSLPFKTSFRVKVSLKDTGGVCRAQIRQHRYCWIKYAAVTDI